MLVLPFCKPTYHRVPRWDIMAPQVRPCFPLNFGYRLRSDWFKLMDAETGRVVHLRDVTWHQPREPLVSPAPTFGSRVPYLSSGAETLDYVYTQPPPVATATPATARAPAPASVAPVPASVFTALAPAPPSKPQHQSPITCSGTWARGGLAHVRTHERRDASNKGLLPQHGSDVPCRAGVTTGSPRGF